MFININNYLKQEANLKYTSGRIIINNIVNDNITDNFRRYRNAELSD